ncbi:MULTISPECIES: hypothetical protein [Pseudomonas]|uniref:hypothetical protein n=1 Tax=Pseudomonas TaxID=286 RepID=UPI0005FC01F6|nr:MULTISPECIES: hypothetical protein [Pseudomonas]KJZ33509.1 heme utilization protein [Pseudomonas fluorescens]OOG15362.1 heme utilization protein [Pseudomonas sp. C9]
MKPTMALKPLVFALAAVMAIAAQAGGRDDDHGHGNGHGNGHNNHQPKHPTFEEMLSISAGAGATVMDQQDSSDNGVLNQGTKNDARADSSLNNSNGNMGANVAAGDGNQQDNAAALATADESFIFGSAVAISSATQNNTGNTVLNYSNTNNANLNNAGNSGSGNIGINVTAGDFNQQKNNLAIAVSGGRVAAAAAEANQTSSGLSVSNYGTQTYKKDELKGTFHAAGGFVAAGKAVSKPADDDHDHGHGNDNRGGGHGGGHDDGTVKSDFVAVGVFGLAGVTTQQVLTPDGWKNPVTNNAAMTNSMNNFSGNGGANVSAGNGNQQSNSLSIAAGCKACL